MEALKNE